jgi:signal peptidase I
MFRNLIESKLWLIAAPRSTQTSGAFFQMRLLLAPLLLLAVATVACSALRRAAVQPVKVQGIAMEPALKDGDRIFIDQSVDKLQRGDIVVFYYPVDPTRSYIKRIVGLPGEAVEIRDGKVLVNGTALEEPYVTPANNRVMSARKEIRLPNDTYYVVGDNRDNSNDSRMWGPLEHKFIYGKFIRKYYSAS